MGTGRNFEFYGWGKVTEALADAKEQNQEVSKKKNKKKGAKESDEVEGIESFTGQLFHSTRWNHSADLRGFGLHLRC